MSESAVGNALASVTRAYDDQNQELFVSHFTEDAVMRIHVYDGDTLEFVGRDGLRTASTPTMAVKPNLLRHLVFHPLIDFESDTVAVARYHQLYMQVGPNPAVKGSGDYVDRLLLQPDGRWLISERDLHFLTPPPR